jgi:hypothetical protein
MLVVGLVQSSSVLLSGSIAASLFAAVLLVVGARRGIAGPPAMAFAGEPAAGPVVADRAGPPVTAQTVSIPVQAKHGPGYGRPALAGPGPGEPVPGGSNQDGPGRDRPTELVDDEADPPDEPAPQQVSAADAARVGRMLAEVLVVDGRPRYHLPGCVHLLGRESEPLPVGEAVELGFTPCSLCEPDSALLADARRV